MRIVSIKISALINLILLSAIVFAQDQPAPLPQTLPPAPGSIEAALAVENPTDRIAALQKFLKTNIIPEQAQTAREAIVASHAQMAEVQLGENNIDKALDDFRKALSLLPEKTSDRFFEETVIRIPLAVSVRGYRNEAIGLARQLEKRYAKEAAPLARIGEFYMTVEAPSDAVRVLEAALALGSEEARFHRALGAAYRIGLRLDDAVSEYQQAIKIDPNEKRAYYELANLYRAHGAYSDAVKLYRKQLELDPKHTPSYKGLALAFLAQNDEEQSSAALTQARDLRGAPEEITQDIYLQTQMAFYFLEQNKLKQARQAAETALLVEPRYAWARIAAAEVDLAENKFFEAERNLLAAQQYAGFPTLFFTFGKVYLAVEDFDGALEQFAKAFSYSPQKQFTAILGGSLEVHSDNLKELLSREHQAAIFLAEPPTNEEQFKLIDALVRFNIRLKGLKPPTTGKSPPQPTPKQLEELEQAADDFIEAERSRRSFRSLHAAQQLAQAGVAPQLAVELADQAHSLADIATLLEGSIRDYPNYDREGRLRIFRGRALDAKGWALFKAGQNEAAIAALSAAAQTYGPLPEGKRALWHLATAKETAGEMREALELYLAGYEPPNAKSSFDVNRSVLESIYRKVNGSTEGLDERLRRTTETSIPAVAAILAKSAPPPNDITQSANETSSRAEAPGAGPATATNEPRLKLSLPSLAAGKDERNSLNRRSANMSTKAESQLIIPRSDPIFAKPSARQTLEPAPAETSAGTPSTVPAPAETSPAPTPLPPIVLPEIYPSIDFSIPLTPMIDQRELFVPWENFQLITVDDEQSEPRPPNPAANPDQPKVHTRKRRVTAPDNYQQ